MIGATFTKTIFIGRNAKAIAGSPLNRSSYRFNTKIPFLCMLKQSNPDRIFCPNSEIRRHAAVFSPLRVRKVKRFGIPFASTGIGFIGINDNADGREPIKPRTCWCVHSPPALTKGGSMFRIFNSKMYVAVLMFLSTMAFSAVASHAQVAQTAVKVNIPFRFIVDNTTLPAGQYTITRSFDEEPTLDMRNPNKDINVLMVAETVGDATTKDKPELVFDKIAGKDFLRQVRTDNQRFVLSEYPMQTRLEKKGEKAQSHTVTCTSMKGMASARNSSH